MEDALNNENNYSDNKENDFSKDIEEINNNNHIENRNGSNGNGDATQNENIMLGKKRKESQSNEEIE